MKLQTIIALVAVSGLASGCMNDPLAQLDCRNAGFECAPGFDCQLDNGRQFSCQPAVSEGSGPSETPINDDEVQDDQSVIGQADDPNTDIDTGPDDDPDALNDADRAQDPPFTLICDSDDNCIACSLDGICIDLMEARDDAEDSDALAHHADCDLTDQADENHQSDAQNGDDAAGEEHQLEVIDEAMLDEIEEAPADETHEVSGIIGFEPPPSFIDVIDPSYVVRGLAPYEGYGPGSIDVRHVAAGDMCVDVTMFGQEMQAFTRASTSGSAQSLGNLPRLEGLFDAAGLDVGLIVLRLSEGAVFDPEDINTWVLRDTNDDGVFDSESRTYLGESRLLVEVDGRVVARGVFTRVTMDIDYHDLSDCNDDDIRAVTDLFELVAEPNSQIGEALIDDLAGRRVRVSSQGQGVSATEMIDARGQAEVRLDRLVLETE